MPHRKLHVRSIDPMHPLNQRVERLLASWQDKRQMLQDQSRTLEAALSAFARGAGEEPLEQKARVEQLRAECDALFNDVLVAVREAQEAGVRRQ
jgi:DnaJ-domain-containing protein 1